MSQEGHANTETKHGDANSHYIRLAIMAVLSFGSMYALMYAMVDAFANVYPNSNQLYMAGLMTAPMIVMELGLMGAMYHNKKWNVLIAALSVAAAIGFFTLIRQQAAIGDEQFLKSMIPHHGGAVLMCEEAQIQDTEVKELCKRVIASQRAEIDQMKAILDRLGK